MTASIREICRGRCGHCPWSKYFHVEQFFSTRKFVHALCRKIAVHKKQFCPHEISCLTCWAKLLQVTSNFAPHCLYGCVISFWLDCFEQQCRIIKRHWLLNFFSLVSISLSTKMCISSNQLYVQHFSRCFVQPLWRLPNVVELRRRAGRRQAVDATGWQVLVNAAQSFLQKLLDFCGFLCDFQYI